MSAATAPTSAPPAPPRPRLLYAGFAIRAASHLIDTVLIMLIVYPALYAVYGDELLLRMVAEAESPSLIPAAADFRLVDFLLRWVLPAVAVVLFWTYRAATPGKMLLGTRIVDARTGGRITARQSVVRYLGYLAATLPLGLGLLWVLRDRRAQGWHDKLAGTVVVREGWVGTPAAFDADADGA